MMENKISVIVPVYNGQDYIASCVESILGQKDVVVEIIIINDGSMDKTAEICLELQKQHDCIHIIALNDQGVSCGRNAGLAAAAGDYITFVDGDDRLLPGTLKLLLELAEQSGSDIIGSGFVSWQNEEDYKRAVEDIAEEAVIDHVTYSGMEFIDKGILGGDTRCWGKLYRRESLEYIRFEEGLTIGEDMLFLLNAVISVRKIAITDYKGYGYFQNPKGAMNRTFKDSYMDQVTCWKKAAEKIDELRPDLKYKAVGIVMVSIMLTVGKIAELSKDIRKQHQDKLLYCRQELKEALKVPGAFASLNRGYQVKVRIFGWFPNIYVKAYNWKKVHLERLSRELKKIVLYMHAGSGNHGCEAIVNSLCHMLDSPAAVVSNSVEEDNAYSLKGLCELLQERKFSEHRIAHVLYYLYRRVTGDRESFIRFRYRPVFGKEMAPLAVSIGGDNYCYDIMVKDLILANNAFHEKGVETVLLGCSIEPDLLQDPAILRDLNSYRAIFARESITYEALKGVLKGGTCLYLYPDPAFTLGKKELLLPEGFQEENTVGINISPMIQENEQKAGITITNYRTLLQHIIDSTDMQIALIPHVVWKRNNDQKPLKELYDTFAHTGRVVMIPDGTCEELKGFIARCRLFIGARTHATIAAYSSLVPTLVVGYSVKARGIARDLFGTEEGYVIPVQSLESEGDLILAFRWLLQEEDSMRVRLAACMPEYCSRALQTGKEVEKLWAELS